MRSGAFCRNRGFTMIELLISAAIGSIILASAYVSLRAAIKGREMVDERSDAIQSARVAMEIIAADLRAATPLHRDFNFVGRRRTVDEVVLGNLDFATHNYTPIRMREGDFCEISYYVDTNEYSGNLSLWRRRDTSPDEQPLTGGTREEIAANIVRFSLEYYDGYEWFSTWGDLTGEYAGRDRAYLPSNVYGMPEAVAVTLELRADEGQASGEVEYEDSPGFATLTFETVVRLDLAPYSYTTTQAEGTGAAAEEGAPAP